MDSDHSKDSDLLGENQPSCLKEWLNELAFTADNECMSVLHAKSLLDAEGQKKYCHYESQRIPLATLR